MSKYSNCTLNPTPYWKWVLKIDGWMVSIIIWFFLAFFFSQLLWNGRIRLIVFKKFPCPCCVATTRRWCWVVVMILLFRRLVKGHNGHRQLQAHLDGSSSPGALGHLGHSRAQLEKMTSIQRGWHFLSGFLGWQKKTKKNKSNLIMIYGT